jgi:DNA-binding NtrC family response regulator
MTNDPNSPTGAVIASARLAPAILVLERGPRLEPILKQQLGDQSRLIRPCRSPNDLIALAERMPASVCVLDWSGWTMELLGLLDRLQVARCGAHPVVIATGELAPLEWAAREAGAVGFFAPPLSEQELVALCGRLLGHMN